MSFPGNESDKKIRTLKDISVYDLKDSQSIFVSLDIDDRDRLEKLISGTRQGVCNVVQKFNNQIDTTKQMIQKTKTEVNNKLEYIRSETRILPKITFISLSGFGGLLLAFKHSNARKIIYSGTAATVATALCYPNQTKLYTRKTTEFTKNKAQYVFTYIWPKKKESEVVFKNPKDKFIQLDGQESFKEFNIKIEEDKGQSSDEDEDMYSTRSK